MSVRWKVDRGLLREPFATDVDGLLAARPESWVVHYGFRTREEQAALYATFLKGGPRAAPPGKSAHEYGLAVDVVVLDGEKHTDWNAEHPAWRGLLADILAHPRLHSLCNIGDCDHIEAVRWRKIADG